MKYFKQTKIKEPVIDDYRHAEVFRKYQIDFSTRGDRTFEEVSEENHLLLSNLLEEINQVSDSLSGEADDYNEWKLDVLSDYIVSTHHQYSERQSLKIKKDLENLSTAIKKDFPETEKIKTLFQLISGEMAAHMKKEEIILFPFIKKLVQAQAENTKIQSAISRVENPINMMIHDHSDQIDAFKEINLLSNHYSSGENELSSIYQNLKELEEDLIKHIHLENNILFPKALILAKEYSNS